MKNVHIGSKDLSKLESEILSIILREEEMSNLRLRKIQSLCKFSDSESIHIDGYPLAKEAGR